MKRIIPIVISAAIVVTVALIIQSRTDSNSATTDIDEQSPQSPTQTMSPLESVVEDQATPMNTDLMEKTTAVPLKAAQSSIRMTVDDILKEPDYKEWPSMLFDLMHEASLEDVQELLAASEDSANYSLGYRDSMKAAAYERWYQLDPYTALIEMDASTLSASQKNSRMEVFLEDWASQSPQEVWSLLEQGQINRVSSDLTHGALARGSALNGNFELLDSALANIADSKLKYYALKSAARSIQRDHGDQFDAWLNTLPESDQNTALAESAWILADQDIERALIGLNQLEQRGADVLPVTRLRVAVKWADSDPVAAADWVSAQNVTGKDRETLFGNVLRVWASKDQPAAIAWVDSLIEKGEIDEAFMNRALGQF